MTHPNLLIGTGTSDDAAVYKLTEDIALVQTVDFFPPVVDDPYFFGAIAVANSLGDVYAKGGQPLTALNIVCFPVGLKKDILGRILRGGMDKANEAGLLIVGGHTIDDPEPKYGLAVTGIIRPGRQVSNAAARAGDKLVLTKPLGTGIITTAGKGGVAPKAVLDHAIEVMATLNKAASDVMLRVGVNACTDVTGYGLLGHLRWMVEATGLTARVSLSQTPVMDGVWDLIAKGTVPGGTIRNLKSLANIVRWDEKVSQDGRIVLADAQTSGGLLMATPPDRVDRLLRELRQAGVQGAVIGEFTQERGPAMVVMP